MKRKSHLSGTRFVLLAVAVLVAATAARGEELKPETLKAWQTYIDLTQQRIEKEINEGRRFLVRDFKNPAEAQKLRDVLKGGGVHIERMQISNDTKKIRVDGGIIHHWHGAIFIPNMTVPRLLRWVQDYDRHRNRSANRDLKPIPAHYPAGHKDPGHWVSSALPGAFHLPSLPQTTELNFAHVPTGGTPAWSSIAGVTNLSSTSQTVTITFTPGSGSAISVSRTLAAGGALRESIGSLFSFSADYRDGWVKVSGTSPLAGFVAYGFSETSGAAVVPVQNTARSTMIFSHVATGPAWGTGIALLNATSTDAAVEVYVMRKTGTLVGGAANVSTASFILPAGTKRAALLTELVPSSTVDDGFVFLRTTNNAPLYGFELFFSRDLKIIANVPPGVLAPGITFAPPAPSSSILQ